MNRIGSKRGFTLIELLVVIAIIAILAAILFPVFLQVKRNAISASCASNLKQITQAWLSYVNDYKDRTAPAYNNVGLPYFPWAQTLLPWPGTPWKSGILAPYLKSHKIAWCPEYQNTQGTWTRDRFKVSFYGYNIEYLVMNGMEGFPWRTDYLSVSRTTFAMIQIPSKTICFMDSVSDCATPPKSGPPAGGKASGGGTLPISCRHNNGWNVSFCDGHVKWYRYDQGQDPVSKDDYLWALDKVNYRK